MAVAVNADDPRYKPRDRQGHPPAAHRPPLQGRSPTSMPIPSSARARSRSPRGTTSTTSTWASAPGIKPGEMLNMFDAEAQGGADRRRADPRRIPRPRPLRRAQAGGRADEGSRASSSRTSTRTASEHDAEPRTIPTPFGDRGGVVIEPWLTDQWYVDAETLAAAADAGGARRADRDRPQELGEDLLQLDGEHPAVVRQPPAVVGAPDSGVVWPTTAGLCRRDRSEASRRWPSDRR